MPAFIDFGFGTNDSNVNMFLGSGPITSNVDTRVRCIQGPVDIGSISVSVRQSDASGNAIATTPAYAGGNFTVVVIRGGSRPTDLSQFFSKDVVSGLGKVVFSRICPANNANGTFTFLPGELSCEANEYITVIVSPVLDTAAASQATLVSLSVTGRPKSDATSDATRYKLR